MHKRDDVAMSFYMKLDQYFVRRNFNLNAISSCLRRRFTSSGHDRLVHEQGQGLNVHLVGKGTWVQGTLGRTRSKDHHDWNPHRSPMVHL